MWERHPTNSICCRKNNCPHHIAQWGVSNSHTTQQVINSHKQWESQKLDFAANFLVGPCWCKERLYLSLCDVVQLSVCGTTPLPMWFLGSSGNENQLLFYFKNFFHPFFYAFLHQISTLTGWDTCNGMTQLKMPSNKKLVVEVVKWPTLSHHQEAPSTHPASCQI